MIKSLIHSMIVCPDVDRRYPRITHGKGVFIYDEDGKEYLDGSSGSAAVSNIGHGNVEIAEIIKKEVSKIAVLPTHAFSSATVERYLDKLVAFAPPGFARAWTVMSGTEATENAVKLAYQYHVLRGEPGRYKVLARWSSYHGNSVFMLDVGGMKMRRQTYGSWLNNFPHLSPAYSYRKPEHQDDASFSESLVNELEAFIQKEGPETIAALILEPVVAAALGAVPPPTDSYLREMKRVCKKYGILLIADEVLTGFGRLGANFGLDVWGVTPDIIAAGKGMSGGYFPLSGVIVHEEISKVFTDNKAPFLGGHTFACNPVGAAVGEFVLDYLQQENIMARAKATGDYLQKKLKGLLDLEIVGDIRGQGMLLGIELVMDKNTRDPFPNEMAMAKKIGQRCIDKGVVLYPGKGSVGGDRGDHIMITPPLIMTTEHADRLVEVLGESIVEVTEETMLRRA